MTNPADFDGEKPVPSESFEERIDLLYEELAFAFQQQRPSILLAFYELEPVRARAERHLENRLAESGHPLLPFHVDEDHFDIPMLLSRHPERGGAAFSVTGLGRGGGEQGANAYRALNIRRELFVDYSIRVIFWLDPSEAVALSRHAPDFWAFRHRVVEFNDPSVTERPETVAIEWAAPGQPGEIDGQIRLAEARLADLPQEAASDPARLELLFRLAGMYHTRQDCDRAIQCLLHGKQVARRLNEITWLAWCWAKLGLVYQEAGQPRRAVRACRKAVHLAPAEAGLWDNLGHFYHIEGRISDAIIAYKHSLRLDPQNSCANSALVACYRRLGKHALAEAQLKMFHP
ncbi:MAG TPA: tetratricopeptide repeat protein [Anaerolineales bacterium]|nr:tetratricopeptide repeat protein [Anaerolineales bacterium]